MAEGVNKNKILKYLILGLIGATLGILIKEVILRPKEISLPQILSQPTPSRIKIDFELLKKLETQELLPFEKLSLPEKIGRENPFEPYLESESE